VDYKGKGLRKCFNCLNGYVQRHLTHSFHLRPAIRYLKTKKQLNLVGAEIGTLRALNAVSIMQNLDIKHLYLIDPYILYDDGINEYQNRSKDLEIAQRRMKPFKNKVTFVVKKSEEALDDVPDSLDFVYIDGNHSYEFVKKDIENYYPKIKPGGIIGGHDFRADCEGLCRAVLEFGDKNNLELNGFPMDWWYEKTK